MRSGLPTNPALIAERTRACLICGVSFVARKSQIDAGHGRWCSHKCAWAGKNGAVLLAPVVKQRAIDNRRASIAVNGTAHKSGAEHSSWKGGKEEAKKRALPKQREALRRYRAANPDLTREWRQNRRAATAGARLPRGTVKRIGEAQRWKCAVCRVGLKTTYHVDHITPPARGGRHEPLNIQLLCPSCNVRKNAKDPVQFMQERGFLL